jgi:hypothetical protein
MGAIMSGVYANKAVAGTTHFRVRRRPAPGTFGGTRSESRGSCVRHGARRPPLDHWIDPRP